MCQRKSPGACRASAEWLSPTGSGASLLLELFGLDRAEFDSLPPEKSVKQSRLKDSDCRLFVVCEPRKQSPPSALTLRQNEKPILSRFGHFWLLSGIVGNYPSRARISSIVHSSERARISSIVASPLTTAIRCSCERDCHFSDSDCMTLLRRVKSDTLAMRQARNGFPLRALP